MNDFYETKDKQVVPFLLTRKELRYCGTRVIGESIYFLFSPLNEAEDLANQFVSRKAPLVQPKDLLEAVESYRDVVFEMKEKIKNERSG